MRNEISNILRDRIVKLVYKPGDPLDENRLAREFAVSRTPVREALILLSAEGLVTFIPHRGARVAEVNVKGLQELLEFRLILEKGIAHLAANKATAEHIERMRRLDAKIQAAAAARNIELLTDYDSEFHQILRDAAHNSYMSRQLMMIHNQFSMMARMISRYPVSLIEDMQRVIRCLETGDGEQLEEILLKHVSYFVEALQQAFSFESLRDLTIAAK